MGIFLWHQKIQRSNLFPFCPKKTVSPWGQHLWRIFDVSWSKNMRWAFGGNYVNGPLQLMLSRTPSVICERTKTAQTLKTLKISIPLTVTWTVFIFSKMKSLEKWHLCNFSSKIKSVCNGDKNKQPLQNRVSTVENTLVVYRLERWPSVRKVVSSNPGSHNSRRKLCILTNSLYHYLWLCPNLIKCC